MNILFTFNHELTIGGHFKSGIAFAEQLIKKDYKVFFLVFGGDPQLINQFESMNIKVINLTNYDNKENSLLESHKKNYFYYKSYCKVIDEFKIDIVHAQDSVKLIPLYFAVGNKRKGFVYSQPGGPFSDKYPPIKSEFFVFSKELVDKYKSIKKYKSRDINIISERISSSIYKPSINKYNLKEGISENKINLMFLMRLHPQKKPFIDSLLAFGRSLCNHEISVNIIVAGDGELKNYIETNAKSIQLKSKNKVTWNFIGNIYSETKIAELINSATAVIGTGRGLMEAMACKKPAIILGENNEFELIQENNIDIISYYNFSGRHFKFHNRENNIKDIIIKLSSNVNLEQISNFSFNYFESNLNASIGASKLIYLYKKSLEKKPNILDSFVYSLYRVFISLKLLT